MKFCSHNIRAISPSLSIRDLCFLFLHNKNKESRVFRNFIKIKMSRLFSIVGDSNVRRNMTGLNTASRESMKSAQIIDCEALATFEAALNEVRAESNTCIIASMTVFVLSGGDCGTISSAVDPILDSVSRRLKQFCQARQDLQVCRVCCFLWPLDEALEICIVFPASCIGIKSLEIHSLILEAFDFGS